MLNLKLMTIKFVSVLLSWGQPFSKLTTNFGFGIPLQRKERKKERKQSRRATTGVPQNSEVTLQNQMSQILPPGGFYCSSQIGSHSLTWVNQKNKWYLPPCSVMVEALREGFRMGKRGGGNVNRKWQHTANSLLWRAIKNMTGIRRRCCYMERKQIRFNVYRNIL